MRREENRQRRRSHREARWQTAEHERRLKIERADERERERRRARERLEWERVQKRANRNQKTPPPVQAPEVAHTSPSSTLRFAKSRRDTHGPSAPLPGSDSFYNHNDSAGRVVPPRSRTAAWTQDLEAGLKPENASLHTKSESQGSARLQKWSRGQSAGASSHLFAGSLSPTSRRSEDVPLSSVGSSSRLFDGRGIIHQRSTSTMPLLDRAH